MKKLPQITIRNIASLLLLTASGVTINSCLDQTVQPPQDITDVTFTFAIGEGFSTYNAIGTPSIFLNIETDSTYPCMNYQILNTLARTDETIEMTLSGVRLNNGVCLTALGPATARRNLGLTSGNYLLLLENGTNVDQYTVTIDSAKIEIDPVDARFTASKYPTYWRRPRHSFAYLCGTTTDSQWMCEAFADTLNKYLNLREISFPDTGELSYPRQTQGHIYDMPARYFAYSDDDTFNQAGQLLKKFAGKSIEMNSGIGISLINWNNDQWHSWLLNSAG